jgi:uncharacterized iron-regulated membrane protein
MITYLVLGLIGLLVVSGLGYWLWRSRRPELPQSPWQPKPFQLPELKRLQASRPLQLAAPNLDQQAPQAATLNDLRTVMAAAGLPLLAEPNPTPPPLPDGPYPVVFLEVIGPRLDKVIAMDIENTDDPDGDFLLLLLKLLELNLITGFHGIPGVGIHIQCHFEQLEWWYANLDWTHKQLNTGLGRLDLHSWS